MFKVIKKIKELGITPQDVYLFIKYANKTKDKLKLSKYFIENFFVKGGMKLRREREMIVSFKKLLIKFLTFSSELSPYKDIFIYEKYEKHPFFKLNSKKIILDIGANIGLYSIKAAIGNKNSKIYSFEPNPFVFKRFLFNIKINNFSNIFAFNNAIGASNKIVKLELKESTITSKICENNSNKNLIEVKMITLDSFIKKYEIPYIDILKIDVEGYALEVLKGAHDTLPIVKGIVMEYHPPYENLNDIENFLRKYNFEKILTFFEYVYFLKKNALNSIFS